MRRLRSLLYEFWNDEIGVILSAEAALLGTVAVIGTTVGLSAVSHSVNEELTEVASAFRSLDQSYHFEGRHGCGAWTAGSSYRQPCVEESLEELQTFVEEFEEHQHHTEHGRHHEESDDDDDRDDRGQGRRESDDDHDDRGDGRRDSDDDDDDRPRRGQDNDRDEDDERPRSRERNDRDDDELSLEIDATADEFSEPIRIRPAAGE